LEVIAEVESVFRHELLGRLYIHGIGGYKTNFLAIATSPAILGIRRRENFHFEKQDWILIVDLLTAGQS